MNTRIFFLSLFLIIALSILFAPTHSTATQSATIWSWCMSDPSASTMYFAGPFDSGMSAKAPTFNALSLGRQFAEYLKGRFDTKGDASCGHGVNSVDQGAALQRMRDVMAQMRQQNKQVIELSDWNYMRDEVAIKASFNAPRGQGDYVNVEGGLSADHIYCVTGSANKTVYYTDPLLRTNPSYNPFSDYFKFLQQKYSFKGDLSCPTINEPQAKLYLNARLAGARAGGKQVVNTGWPPANFNTTAQVSNDRYQDNEQPAQRPAPNQTSNQVRDIAAKEVTQALAYCHNNRAMGRGYDCACLQVKIYEYRIAHPAETLKGTPTLSSLFDGKAFQCDKCINDYLAKMLAHDAAYSAGLKSPAAQDCAAQKFVASLHANPSPSQAQAELDAAFKACR